MSIIEEIKARIDIVDLIKDDAAVKLHHAGRNWAGFCPFHSNTHTPALIVFPDTQTFYCFGSCNEGGTVIDWVLKKNPGWDVKEAIKELAHRASIPLGEMDGPELRQRLAVRAREDALQIAAHLFAKWLLEDEEALKYARSRGWSDETINASRLGFSGRATSAQVKEMKGEFDLHGIKHTSPDAVMILGFKGDVAKWAKDQGLDPTSFKEHGVHGMMSNPGLIYAHKLNGRIVYLSRRNLPGHDKRKDSATGEMVEWKSHNPQSALAGSKVPYFNHMHQRGDRIVIVEGQADAITLGQWGVPAMALCGSAWKNLGEYVAMLTAKDRDGHPKYETIYFATDTDTPGEAIVTGTKKDEGKFPLTTTFGPMLWVARWPRKDANEVLKHFTKRQRNVECQLKVVERILARSKPIVLLAAQYAGSQKGAGRQKALELVVPLIARMPDTTRNDYRPALAKALFPTSGKMLQDYNKLLSDQLKKGDDEDKPLEIVETLGGWFPTSEDGEKGYLLELVYDPKRQKAKFAYRDPDGNVAVAPWLNINGVRYIPQVDDVVKDETVIFASDLGPLKSIRELTMIIELYLRRYFLLDRPIDYKLASFYALFTWVYDGFDALAYFRYWEE